MLSDIASTTHLNRPRPPGSRRCSANKIEKVKPAQVEDNDDNGQKENEPVPLKASASLASSSPAKQMNMVNDLELDLPQDFAAAFHRKPRYWPQARKSTGPASVSRDEDAASRSSVGESLGRDQGHHGRGRQEGHVNLFDPNVSPRKNSLDSLCRSGSGDLHDISPIEASEDEDQGPPSIDFDVESEHSMTSEWVGDLPREELETLLIEANRVIRDRERELGIAAAVGKALLEKNISMKKKHEGFITRLSSVNSFTQFNSAEEDVCSPASSYSGGVDGTPTPTGLVDDYFDSTKLDEAAKAKMKLLESPFKSKDSTIPLASQWTSTVVDRRDSWNLSHDYIVPSVPPSPADTHAYDQSRSLGHLQLSNETQRQLEILSEQNEALLEQLSDLQREAEEAKRNGGKRLKKLNREIDGLRTELEAATERNFELERVAADEIHRTASEAESSTRVRRAWKRRGASVRESSEGADATLQSSSPGKGCDESALEAANDGMTTPARSTVEVASDAGSMVPRSESSLSWATQNKVTSEPERALVAQLMSKIRELEETNAVLALAGTEMDGRIGKAMEEGERIRDAYEAVENVAAFEESQMKRDDSDILETHYTGSPFSCTSVRSLHKYRRAPGNRYRIEGRRTVRAALKQEKNQDEYEYDSSISSLAASPIMNRGLRRTLRPRILITPSSEDLRAASKSGDAAAAGWGDVNLEQGEDNMSSTPMKNKQQMYYERGPEGGFGSMRSLDSVASMAFHGRQSLGSELGSVFGGDEVSASPTSFTPLGYRDEPLRLTDLRRSSSGGSVRLRSRASINSLRAPSEAESDIADLRWSVSSDATVHADDEATIEHAGQWQGQQDETVRELAIITTGDAATSSPLMGEQDDGNWCVANNEVFVPRGCLQNELESTHDSYEWIEKATRRLPLHWADDDDFGKPITEGDARRLGLLEGPSLSTQQTTKGLLAWVQGRTARPVDDEGKSRRAGQIQSAEQAEELERLGELLREKRVVALQKRVLSGQISSKRAREMGLDVEYDDERSIKQLGEVLLEKEVTARAVAYSTARSRRLRASKTMMAKKQTFDDKDNMQSSDEDYELVDLDPSKRRPGRRGTDYYPITLRERYKPTMVKQRAKHFSGEAITWASAWATFSLVMVFAFLVTFSRGPKRVLNGQSSSSIHNRKR